mmetsp:Transcript_29282/g.55323  ORF Transcript_29282/g.55323 Transcript_29282/m.55323 type:complete len:345 (-) Transcript_29282:767-1801(-)
MSRVVHGADVAVLEDHHGTRLADRADIVRPIRVLGRAVFELPAESPVRFGRLGALVDGKGHPRVVPVRGVEGHLEQVVRDRGEFALVLKHEEVGEVRIEVLHLDVDLYRGCAAPLPWLQLGVTAVQEGVGQGAGFAGVLLAVLFASVADHSLLRPDGPVLHVRVQVALLILDVTLDVLPLLQPEVEAVVVLPGHLHGPEVLRELVARHDLLLRDDSVVDSQELDSSLEPALAQGVRADLVQVQHVVISIRLRELHGLHLVPLLYDVLSAVSPQPNPPVSRLAKGGILLFKRRHDSKVYPISLQLRGPSNHRREIRHKMTAAENRPVLFIPSPRLVHRHPRGAFL